MTNFEVERSTRLCVLAIDTAGPITGIGYVSPHTEYSWSHRIVKGADVALLQKLEQIASQYPIDLVAVSVGPGSFNSLRVGVAIALGFALARGLKVVGLSSLQVRAAMFPHECCLALLDARRERVYGQLFDSTTDVPIPLSSHKDMPLSSLIPKQSFIAVGEGAMVYRDLIVEQGGFVPLDADRSPALQAAKMGRELAELAVHPAHIQVDYVRSASVVPPKQLGVPVGKPAEVDAEHSH